MPYRPLSHTLRRSTTRQFTNCRQIKQRDPRSMPSNSVKQSAGTQAMLSKRSDECILPPFSARYSVVMNKYMRSGMTNQVIIIEFIERGLCRDCRRRGLGAGNQYSAKFIPICPIHADHFPAWRMMPLGGRGRRKSDPFVNFPGNHWQIADVIVAEFRRTALLWLAKRSGRSDR